MNGSFLWSSNFESFGSLFLKLVHFGSRGRCLDGGCCFAGGGGLVGGGRLPESFRSLLHGRIIRFPCKRVIYDV